MSMAENGAGLAGPIGSVAGAVLDRFLGKKDAQKQYEQQKEFAKSGIQWRVEDAEKAGIHPLYALGAQTTSYSPVSVGGASFADVGQNIGRAIDATRSNPEKASALAQTAAAIQLEGLKLDNDLKRAQLASATALASQTQSAPGLPTSATRAALLGIEGQGNMPQAEGIPDEQVMGPQFTPWVKAGNGLISTNPGWSDAQTYEDRYGDAVDIIVGPGILASDLAYTMKEKAFALWELNKRARAITKEHYRILSSIRKGRK